MAQRLIAYRGRLLHSHGRLLVSPVPFVLPPQARETFSLGDGVTVGATFEAETSDAFALSDGVSANPPGASVAESFALADGATVVSVTTRPAVSDSFGLGDGAAATVSSALSGTNSGPYPRLNIDPADRPDAVYDGAGKSYITVASGTAEWTSLFGIPVDANGLGVSSFFLFTNPGDTFTIFSQTHLGVKGGRTIGAAGTVYEVQFYIGLDNGTDAVRDMQITSV